MRTTIRLDPEAVTSVEDLRSAAKEADKTLALLVQRNNARIYVPVNLG